MKRTIINAGDAPAPQGSYSQAVSIEGHDKLLFVSGQVPVGTGGEVPPDFAGQARLAWQNIDAQLRAGGMDRTDLVKVTTFLASRDDILANREARSDYLGDLRPALTVIMCGIFDEGWLLEIEAIAAR